MTSREPNPRTHFELFGLQPLFDLPAAELEDRFHRYQSAVHPDRHAGGSDSERRLALHLAANGNEAYRILSHATSRAAYLCELNNAPIDAERNTAMPQDFLVRQMQWREAIEALDGIVGQARGASATELATRLGEEKDRTIAQLRELIDCDHDYPQAATLVRQLMFYDKLRSAMRQVLRLQL